MRRRKINRTFCRIFTLFLFVAEGSAFAITCPTPQFSSADQIRLHGSTAILVTHATTKFDPRRTIENGLDAVIRFANRNAVPFVYLHDKDDPPEEYFYPTCSPTYWYNSGSGDFHFVFKATHVISLGGFSEACQGLTVRDVSKIWSHPEFASKDLRLSLVTDGLYSFDLLWARENDPFYSEYKKWIASLSEQDDISIQEVRDFIRATTPDAQYWEKTVLRRWFRFGLGNLPETHQIVFAIDGEPVEVIREGNIPAAKVLTVDFVNSELFQL